MDAAGGCKPSFPTKKHEPHRQEWQFIDSKKEKSCFWVRRDNHEGSRRQASRLLLVLPKDLPDQRNHLALYRGLPARPTEDILSGPSHGHPRPFIFVIYPTAAPSHPPSSLGVRAVAPPPPPPPPPTPTRHMESSKKMGIFFFRPALGCFVRSGENKRAAVSAVTTRHRDALGYVTEAGGSSAMDGVPSSSDQQALFCARASTRRCPNLPRKT